MASKLPICQIASCEGSKKLCVPIGIWAFLCPQQQHGGLHGLPLQATVASGHGLYQLCVLVCLLFLAPKKLFFSFSRAKTIHITLWESGGLLAFACMFIRHGQIPAAVELGTTKNLLFTYKKWLHQFIMSSSCQKTSTYNSLCVR